MVNISFVDLKRKNQKERKKEGENESERGRERKKERERERERESEKERERGELERCLPDTLELAYLKQKRATCIPVAAD